MVITKTHGRLARSSIVLAFLSISLGGCATSTPTIDTGPNAEVTFDGLHEVQHSSADKAWAKPDLDLSGYSKIMLQGAGIEYRPGGESGRMAMSRSRGGPYEVNERQKVAFRKLVGEVLLKELGKSEKFTLVSEPGPDVLLIRGAILDVVSYVPPEPVGGRSEVFLSSIGEATLVLEIRDSITDAILVRAIDRDTVGNNGGMTNSNRATNSAEVSRLIRQWMSKLRERLDSFSGYANVG